MLQAQINTTMVSNGGSTTPRPRKMARRTPPREASDLGGGSVGFMGSGVAERLGVWAINCLDEANLVRWTRRTGKWFYWIHAERTARATTAKETRRAPALRTTRAISFAVAPVVNTSSTSSTCRPATPRGLAKA